MDLIDEPEELGLSGERLARIPSFRLAEGAEVQWAGGQVRGPRVMPLVWD